MNLLVTLYKKEKLKNKLRNKVFKNNLIVVISSLLFLFDNFISTFMYSLIFTYCYFDNKKLEEFISFIDEYKGL